MFTVRHATRTGNARELGRSGSETGWSPIAHAHGFIVVTSLHLSHFEWPGGLDPVLVPVSRPSGVARAECTSVCLEGGSRAGRTSLRTL